MRFLEKGEKVRFNAFNVLSGDYVAEGTIEGEAVAWIEANRNHPDFNPEAYSELAEGDAYGIRKRNTFGNIQRHLVFVGDIVAVLPAEEER